MLDINSYDVIPIIIKSKQQLKLNEFFTALIL